MDPRAAARSTWWRPVIGAAILVGLGWRIGRGPFLDGLSALSGGALLAAVAVTAVTTLASAWRWRVIATALGSPLPLRRAVAAYYRSQFLNSALPGGVLGDLHRGVRHGRDVDDVGRGLRAVALDRTAGQVVQTGLAMVILLALASPVRSRMPLLLALVLALALAGAAVVSLAVRRLPAGRSLRLARLRQLIGADVRRSLLDRRAWPTVAVSSVVVVAGHAAIFILAARLTGTDVAAQRLLPLTMLALLAMSIPLSIGGWGPREGATAWVFGAAGLGVEHGIATATAYGAMAFVATLPGAVVLIAGAVHRDQRRSAAPTVRPPIRRPVRRPRSVPALAGADRD
ncbi:uncharacterized membrane protein YbhN (UPF0104 family) [Jatrophihabitans sp. GAS493]|uniref:lysylphosphatidylglycerol synthase transmembrane domain-containing protein n=1 Tax=Jatrophihabitans sp. GAS493 TaxID=1907575 RepID=UPI000BB77FE7|nr:lysylphosphatidylglycerol synthase transmembrane domain-containing protein [Jatrophihabitans sp. GAS493]SOD74914.1 uncharacterized membrane protein YbhN (UPF0104 family) [Jatrophihabitans sp. GAS493]